jgi:hypothetical protein
MLIRNRFDFARPYRDTDDDGGSGEMSEEEKAVARGDVVAEGQGVETDIGKDGSQKSEKDVAAANAKKADESAAKEDDTKADDEKEPDTAVADEAEKEVEDVKEEVKAEVDAEEAEKAKRDSQMIPRSRLDAKNRILRETQAKLQATEERLRAAGVDIEKSDSPREEAVAEFDTKIIEAEKELIQAKKDGDVEAEVKALGKIRSLEREQYKTQLEIASKEATSRAVATTEYDDTLSALEELIPSINPDSEDTYDQDAVDEMREMVEAFEAKGYASNEALVTAANYIFPEEMGNIKSINEQRDKTEAAKKAEEARTKAAKEKAAEAISKAAPDTKGVGDAADKAGSKAAVPDGEKLSDDEFDKLPESTKARMRGDFV